MSSPVLSQLNRAARHHLEELFSEPQPLVELPADLPIEPGMFLCRLDGHCTIPSISSIFKPFDYQPNSVGYLSEALHAYGRSVPSTVSRPDKTVVFYLSAEMFATQRPLLVTIEAQSTAVLKIELASHRSAETWKAQFDDLGAHRFHSIGRAADRGGGLTAG